MPLADRPAAEQTIGRWSPGHLSERVVTQTLLITLVAHHEAAKRHVKHTLLKKNQKKTEYNIYSKEIFQEIKITDLPGIFICGICYFSNTLLKQNGSLPFYLLSDMS